MKETSNLSNKHNMLKLHRCSKTAVNNFVWIGFTFTCEECQIVEGSHEQISTF
jgi:hypothetical protein